MILPDVNVLLYAFRMDAPQHPQYHAWLSGVLNSGAPYGMSTQVLASVVRIATHPRIYARPSDREDVLAFCSVLLTHPRCQTIHPGDRHWEIFRTLCEESRASGNLVQDAWFAALAMESGCEWVSTDRDYSRFKGLRWRDPLSP